MKKILTAIFCAAAVMLGAAEPVKELKVLTIGNSFSDSIFQTLPAIVNADPSCKLTLVGANIGGCSLKKHWEQHLKAEKKPGFKPYLKKFTLRELLKQEKWDIVTIQQVSTDSWKKETYQPYAENIIKLVRELAPSAEIVIQQTWSYNAASGFFAQKSWNIDQTQMYEKLNEAYLALAKQYNFRVIPTGLAVQLYRKELGGKLTKNSAESLKALKRPALPANNDVVGNFSWRKEKNKESYALRADCKHMNADGKYLQGLVWYGFLFGKDPNKAAYAPKDMKTEQAALLKKCAADAIAQFPQVRK